MNEMKLYNARQAEITATNYVCVKCGACDWKHEKTINDNRAKHPLMQKHIYRCGKCNNQLHETRFIIQTLGGDKK